MPYDQDNVSAARLLGLDIVDWSLLLGVIGLTALWRLLEDRSHKWPSRAENLGRGLHRPSRSGSRNWVYVADFAAFRRVVSGATTEQEASRFVRV